MSGSRSRLRDRVPAPRTVTIEMTPRQAEQFYDALWEVATTRRQPYAKGKQAALAELRRRIFDAAELWEAAPSGESGGTR